MTTTLGVLGTGLCMLRSCSLGTTPLCDCWFLSCLNTFVTFCSAEKGVVFGSPLTEEGIAQVSQLIEYLHKSK